MDQQLAEAITVALDDRLREQMDSRFDRVDSRFEQIDSCLEQRFQQINHRFEKIDLRFEEIDLRFEEINGRFKNMHDRIDNLEEKLSQQISETRNAFTASIQELDRKIIASMRTGLMIQMSLFGMMVAGFSVIVTGVFS